MAKKNARNAKQTAKETIAETAVEDVAPEVTAEPKDDGLTKCIVAVASGAERYFVQTDYMLQTFIEHNRGWDVRKFYGADLDVILPQECLKWTPFSKAEIGRFIALSQLATQYDIVLYCDGDMEWHGEYKVQGKNALTFSSHYITDEAKQRAAHLLIRHGVYNTGLIEIARGEQGKAAVDLIIRECMRNPSRWSNGTDIWLQTLCSYIPSCGHDVGVSDDATCNVAKWNLQWGDRKLIEDADGGFSVECNGKTEKLTCYHFSHKSFHQLPQLGAGRIAEGYAMALKQLGINY